MQLRALPVVFACHGCAQYGDRAHEVASVLDAWGLAEASWLGAGAAEDQLASKARSRFPVFVVEGCAKRCAGQWLAKHGARVQREFVLAAGPVSRPAGSADNA